MTTSSAFLLADVPGQADVPVLVMGALAMLIVLSFGLIVLLRYKRCASNQILVVYGKTGPTNVPRCVHGGGALVWPVIQHYAYLSLDPLPIAIPLSGAQSVDRIRVDVPSAFTVAIGTDAETMQNAAVRLLGLSTPEIVEQAKAVLAGQLRQLIATLRVDEIDGDRAAFLERIRTSLAPELKKIGLVLVHVDVQDVRRVKTGTFAAEPIA